LDFVTRLVRRYSTKFVNNDDCTSCVIKKNDVGVYDIVTSCDVEIEKMLIQDISKRYPRDKFYCEEQSNNELTDERTWVIDPIDGTVNFSRGIPLFGTQLALLVNKNPVLAVIYLPSTDEMYSAAESQGARLNGLKIGSYPSRKLKECIISLSDFSRKQHYYRDMQAKIMMNMYDEVARFKILGASCCDFAMLASGKIDMHMRFINNLWDYMPGLYISTKAGACYDEELLEKNKFLLMAYSKETCKEFREKVLKDLFASETNTAAIKENECERNLKSKYSQKICITMCNKVSLTNMEDYCRKLGIILPHDLKYDDFEGWIETYLNALSTEESFSLMNKMGLCVSGNDIGEPGGVFIIHSSKDKEFVKAITDGLIFLGITDSQIYCSSIENLGTDLGESFHTTIKGRIRCAGAVICVLSEDSVKSEYCLEEIGACMALDKTILPVLVDGSDPNIMPGFLDSRHQYSCFDTEAAVNMFLRSVSERVGAKPDDLAISMGVKTILSSVFMKR